MEPLRYRSALGWPLPAAVAVACLVLAGSLEAQASPAAERSQVDVTGRVVDTMTGTALPAVRIRLRPAEGDPASDLTPPPRIRETLTDADGQFTIEAVGVATYRLTAESLGYATLESAVRVMGASPFDIRVRLAPEAMALEGVVVTSARSPRLAVAGFYDRQARNYGSFVTRADIEARFAFITSDLFRTLPGVRVIPTGRGTTSNLAFRRGCRPDIVMDGMNLGANLSVDEIISPSEVEAIEVYRGPGSPVSFSSSSCGVVVIWSADPATRTDGRPMSWRRFFMAAGFVALAILTTR